MPFDKVTVVIEALKEINTKAVLVGGDMNGTEDEWTSENICHITSVPYSWLLSKCSMLLCRGGAGTVHAALRAGVPSVISPLMGDQFFWAKLIEAYGLGTKAGTTLKDVTTQDYIKAIARGYECKDASKELGDTIRSKKLGIIG